MGQKHMCPVGDVAIAGLHLCPAQHPVEQTLPSMYVWNVCTEHAGIVRLNCMQRICSVPWCQHRVCQQGAPVQAAMKLTLLEQQLQERRAAVAAKQQAAKERSEAKSCKGVCCTAGCSQSGAGGVGSARAEIGLRAAVEHFTVSDTVDSARHACSDECGAHHLVRRALLLSQPVQQCAFGYQQYCQDARRLLGATHVSSMCNCIPIWRGPLQRLDTIYFLLGLCWMPWASYTVLRIDKQCINRPWVLIALQGPRIWIVSAKSRAQHEGAASLMCRRISCTHINVASAD